MSSTFSPAYDHGNCEGLTAKRNVRCGPLLAALSFGLSLIGVPIEANAQTQTAPGPIVYRLGVETSPTHPQGVLVLAFKAEVEKKSDGRIQFELFTRAQLGRELDMISGVRAGNLDVASVASTAAGSVFPALTLSLLPYFFEDREAARKVLDGEPGQMALKTLEEKGVKGLVWGEIGYNALINSKKPVASAADAKGMKIRVVENPLFVATWRALGASPVPMAWPEVYIALQQKSIDGVDTSLASMVDGKLYEPAKHVALTQQNYYAQVLIMNLAKFNALPDDLKRIVEDAAKVAAAESRKAGQKGDDEAIATMKSHGAVITQVPRDQFRESVKALHDDWAAKIGSEIVTKARMILGNR